MRAVFQLNSEVSFWLSFFGGQGVLLGHQSSSRGVLVPKFFFKKNLRRQEFDGNLGLRDYYFLNAGFKAKSFPAEVKKTTGNKAQ